MQFFYLYKIPSATLINVNLHLMNSFERKYFSKSFDSISYIHKQTKSVQFNNCEIPPGLYKIKGTLSFNKCEIFSLCNKQLLDEVEHDIMNYQNRGLRYLPKPKAEADNTDTRF